MTIIHVIDFVSSISGQTVFYGLHSLLCDGLELGHVSMSCVFLAGQIYSPKRLGCVNVNRRDLYCFVELADTSLLISRCFSSGSQVDVGEFKPNAPVKTRHGWSLTLGSALSLDVLNAGIQSLSLLLPEGYTGVFQVRFRAVTAGGEVMLRSLSKSRAGWEAGLGGILMASATAAVRSYEMTLPERFIDMQYSIWMTPGTAPGLRLSGDTIVGIQGGGVVSLPVDLSGWGSTGHVKLLDFSFSYIRTVTGQTSVLVLQHSSFPPTVVIDQWGRRGEMLTLVRDVSGVCKRYLLPGTEQDLSAVLGVVQGQVDLVLSKSADALSGRPVKRQFGTAGVDSGLIEPVTRARKVWHFATLDIETHRVRVSETEVKLLPLSVSICYLGDVTTFVLDEHRDERAMMKAVIEFLMELSLRGKSAVKPGKTEKLYVFAHNLGGFDVMYLLHPLYRLGKVRSVYREGLLSLESGDMIFRDSKKLLDSSLESLAKTFNVSVQKGSLPYNFLTRDSLSYVGVVPAVEYWRSEQDYKECVARLDGAAYDLRAELVAYNEADAVCLHQVLSKMRAKWWSLNLKVQLDPLSFMSASSLAFATFRSSFYGENKLANMHGQADQDIRKAYMGGRVELLQYAGKGLHHYDVSSLYSSVMAGNAFPVGRPVKVEKASMDQMGFAYASVVVPVGMALPPLMFRHPESDRLMSPTGAFSGWYFLPELKMASEYGVQVELHEGWIFQSAFLFKSYVDAFYGLKQEAGKRGDKAMRSLVKLLLNGLYGRFGLVAMKDELELMSFEAMEELRMSGQDLSFLGGFEGRALVLSHVPSDEMLMNVGVAAAVTAYARMRMYPVLSLLAGESELWYTDTDSIFTSELLDGVDRVGSGLGELEYQGFVEEAIFASDKLYALKYSDGRLVCRARGLRGSELSWSEYASLLSGGVVERGVTVWQRDMAEGAVTLRDVSYHVRGDQGVKRQIVVDASGASVSSTPMHLSGAADQGGARERSPPGVEH